MRPLKKTPTEFVEKVTRSNALESLEGVARNCHLEVANWVSPQHSGVFRCGCVLCSRVGRTFTVRSMPASTRKWATKVLPSPTPSPPTHPLSPSICSLPPDLIAARECLCHSGHRGVAFFLSIGELYAQLVLTRLEIAKLVTQGTV